MQPHPVELDRETHTYRHRGMVVPGIHEVLREAGIMPAYTRPDAAYWRELGREIHRTCALHDLEDLVADTVDPAVLPYLESYKASRELFKFVPEIIEVPLVHPVFLFAGTPDRGVLLEDGTRAVLELKIGDGEDWWALQTAGQQLAFEANGYATQRRMALRLRPHGRPEKPLPYTEPTDRAVFIAALQVCQWKRSRG